MFYDDLRALRQIHANALEESCSEVSANLLLDISALSLRCASRWLAAEQSYVWSRALDAWNRSSKFNSSLQNILSGGTYFDIDERKEILQKAAEDCYQTLFKIEDLLVDIAKIQSEETARKSMASARFYIPPGATPLRRTESTAGGLLNKAKNWMTLVYHTREVVWKALDLGEDDRNLLDQVFRKSSFSQNASTRKFVSKVLEALTQARPGSLMDFRGPSWRFILPWTRTKQQKQLLHKTKHGPGTPSPLNPQPVMPISSAFTSSTLQFHIPFWDSILYRGIKYGLFTWGAFVGFTLFRKMRPSFIPTAIESARSWFDTHLWEPGQAMVDELVFNRKPKQNTRHAAKEASESLTRMLNDFRKARGLDIDAKDLSDISRAYEKQIEHPLQTAIGGDLIRLGLIQAQALKSETLSLATELDDLIAENHFNSQILATLPALALLGVFTNILSRVYRYTRDESNSRESARLEIRLALWDLEMLIIREDDGPSLFSFLSGDDRGSETGGSENWGQNMGGAGGGGGGGAVIISDTKGSNSDLIARKGSVASMPGEAFAFDEEDLMHISTYADESLSVEPATRYRRQLAGQMICTLHHLINLLIKSKGVLFRGRDREWFNAMRDANYLFPRDGWSAHARLELVRNLETELLALSGVSDFQLLTNW